MRFLNLTFLGLLALSIYGIPFPLLTFLGQKAESSGRFLPSVQLDNAASPTVQLSNLNDNSTVNVTNSTTAPTTPVLPIDQTQTQTPNATDNNGSQVPDLPPGYYLELNFTVMGFDESGSPMSHWGPYQEVKDMYNDYTGKSKLMLRDDGKIYATYGDQDGLSILLGNAYWNGWIQPGWYVTDSYFMVVSKQLDSGEISYSMSRYTSLEDAGSSYDSMYLYEQGASAKALINGNSMVVDASRTAGNILPVGFYFYSMGFPSQQTVE